MSIPIIIFIVIAIIVFIVLLLFGGARSEPRDSGQAGEHIVASILSKCAKPDDKIINNILLYHEENGKSSQIDHIFIAENGVYVIETKNISGKIYGNDHMTDWTQYLGKNEQKFYSPIKQNKTHVYIVKNILKEEIPIRGIVVFVQGNIEHIESTSVFTPDTLPLAFQFPSAETPLGAETKNRLYQKLCTYRDTHPIAQSEHLANIQKIKTEIANNICPRCNAKLVLRNGKYGKFYGCSNYPKCKFTKEI